MEEVIVFDYMWENEISAHVVVTKDKIICKNYTDCLIKKPFLNIDKPTLEDYDYLLESRVFPRERANCKELLKGLEIEYYSPYLICEKTRGVLTDDHCWIRFEGDEATKWEDIDPRRKSR